jgi:hypothetical protein
MSYDEVPRRPPTGLSARVRGVGHGVVGCVRTLAFWFAIVAPWLLLAMVAGGYVTNRPGVFAGLLGGAVTCIVVGRNHGR